MLVVALSMWCQGEVSELGFCRLSHLLNHSKVVGNSATASLIRSSLSVRGRDRAFIGGTSGSPSAFAGPSSSSVVDHVILYIRVRCCLLVSIVILPVRNKCIPRCSLGTLTSWR